MKESSIMQRTVTCVAVLAISACHGGAKSGAGSGSGSGSAAAAKSTDEASGRCVETALFAPRALGKGGNDMYRGLQIDPVTKDIYAVDLHTIVRVPAAGGEPAIVVNSEAGVGSWFWLRSDRFLFPGDDVSKNGEQAVLFAMPREGGELTPIIPIPAGDPSTFHRLSDVRVIGDDVYWQVDEGTRGKRDSTHSFFTTSWKEPGTPKRLFSSKHDVDGDLMTPGFVIAGGRAYILEKLGDTADSQVENVIDLATGAVSRLAPALGGFVIGGDAESLIVRRIGTRSDETGAFRMKSDGTQVLRISETVAPRLAVRDGTWAVVAHNRHKGIIEVSTVVAATGAHKALGCVNGDATVHAMALTDDAIYVSVFRSSKATILRFAR
jgi:hypothetical protein